MAASTSHNLEDSNEQPTYLTSRRKENNGKMLRNGPSPVEDIVKQAKERPGQLSVSKKNNEAKQSLAGSIELLEYFLRLSHNDSKEEYLDTRYIMALINSGADINSVDDYGQTVLHAVARDWNPDAARFLIDNGADVNKEDRYGRTPIFTAVLLDYPEMIEFLASRGAKIHKRTAGEKQTLVHYAVRGNAVKSLKTLLKLGASAITEDYKGRSPLFVAAEQGNSDVIQHLLDIGCPVAAYDKDGYSAMAHMVEKMPNVALEALSQFLEVNTLVKMKSYYLAPLEFDPRHAKNKDQKTTLEMIVKYSEVDLLLHPVIQRLLKMKWKMNARFHVLNYFFLNVIYVMVWTALGIASSAKSSPFQFRNDNIWVITLVFLGFILTIASAVQQLILARNTQKSENKWKAGRIASLQQDLRYCHPQWPNEQEMIEAQIGRYSSMLSEYYKSIWVYLDLIIFIAATVWAISSWIAAAASHLPGVKETERIALTVVLFLAWMRFLKACRAFKICGQFIAILGEVILALGKFAFLFFLFFVPFVIAFWVLFGGDTLGDKIKEKYPSLGDAFRKFNDVIYTVWTMTVLAGFPMIALRHIDKTIANAFVAIYYLVMSVVTLNLMIAFLSNVFSRVYKDTKKYALLQQATVILLSENFVAPKVKQKSFEHMKRQCNPLIERIKFREIVNNEQKSPENTLDKITNKMQAILGLIQGNKKSDMVFNRSAMIRQINHNMNMIDNTMGALDYMLGKIQKFNVEIKKTQRILVPGTNHDSKKKSVKRRK